MTEVSKLVQYNRTIKSIKAAAIAQAKELGRSAKLVSKVKDITIWVVAERKGKKVTVHFEHVQW